MLLFHYAPDARRLARRMGYFTAVCGFCEGTGISLRSRDGNFMIINDPCAICFGGRHLWVRDGDPIRYSDAELLECYSPVGLHFTLEAAMFDPLQRLDAEFVADLPESVTLPRGDGIVRVTAELLQDGRVRFEALNGGLVSEVANAREALQAFLLF